jgi:hypothetical protein
VPDLRALLVAVGVGSGFAAYTLLWWHWPLAIGAGAGILLGALALTGTISVGHNGADADAAWRAAAPDLVEAPAEPSPEVTAAQATGPRARDIPSGD